MMAEIRPTVLVILGAAGDLTHRKLLPALFNLFLDKQLPQKFSILGVDRKQWDQETLRSLYLESVNSFSRRGNAREESWALFAKFIKHVSLDFTDNGSYSKLGNAIQLEEQSWSEE